MRVDGEKELLKRREKRRNFKNRIKNKHYKVSWINFIESYCVKITDIPIHLINQIKDQSILRAKESKRREEKNKSERISYLFLIRMDYTPRKLQLKLMKNLTQMYADPTKSNVKREKRDYLKSARKENTFREKNE